MARLFWIIRDWVWNFEENWQILPGRIKEGIKKTKEACPWVAALKAKESAMIAGRGREARQAELAYEGFP